MWLVLSRLFVLFIQANLKNVLIVFLGVGGLIELTAFDVRVSFIDRALTAFPFAVGIASAITFLTFWPLWFARVKVEAKLQNQTFAGFVKSDAYLSLLSDWKASLTRS